LVVVAAVAVKALLVPLAQIATKESLAVEQVEQANQAL
jgi:hypothetical protein